MTDDLLEKAIDQVGRDKVFDRARALGWGDGGAPSFVWWGIVRELQLEEARRRRATV